MISTGAYGCLHAQKRTCCIRLYVHACTYAHIHTYTCMHAVNDFQLFPGDDTHDAVRFSKCPPGTHRDAALHTSKIACVEFPSGTYSSVFGATACLLLREDGAHTSVSG
jgi:hypothetical protein